MNIILNAQGKNVNQQTGELFKGVVPRDLEVLDTFQVVKQGVKKTLQITGKEVDEEGFLIIDCGEVV